MNWYHVDYVYDDGSDDNNDGGDSDNIDDDDMNGIFFLN